MRIPWSGVGVGVFFLALSWPGARVFAQQSLLYRLSIDLPEPSAGSHLSGDYMVRSADSVLAEGTVELPDLSTSQGRSFQVEIDLGGLDLTGQELLWRFRGSLYAAAVDETFGPMVMRATEWTPSLTSVGYHITITSGGGFQVDEQVDHGDAGAEAVPLPLPGGPYAVGVRSYFWVDGDRGESLTTDPDDRRHLLVQAWYPAQRTEPGTRAPYLQQPEAFGLTGAATQGTPVLTNSFADAPLSDERPRYPVVIFSHGMRANRFSSTFLMEELASRGFVVFSIGHTFFNGVEVFPDGYRAVQDVFPEVPPTSSQEEAYRAFSEFVFRTQVEPMALDARFVLDQVELLVGDAGSFFSHRLDLEHVAALGWSIGGVAAAHLVRTDPRVRAGANLDGTWNAVVADAGVDRPFMHLKSDHEGGEPATEEFRTMVEHLADYEARFAAHSGQLFVMRIAGVSHADFSDRPLLRGAAGSRDATARRHAIIRALTVAFLHRYLLNDASVDLMEVARSYPEVVPGP